MAAHNGIGVTLRLTNKQLSGGHKLTLSCPHITKKKMAGTRAELKLQNSNNQNDKDGWFSALLTLLPMLLGGLSAAGTMAGGSAEIAKAIGDRKAANAAQAERHNREVEAQSKICPISK